MLISHRLQHFQHTTVVRGCLFKIIFHIMLEVCSSSPMYEISKNQNKQQKQYFKTILVRSEFAPRSKIAAKPANLFVLTAIFPCSFG